MLIVGAGEAGARAAMALRENGFEGAVTLIGDEPHLPYERPPLSKAVLLADGELEAPFIHTEQRLTEHDIAVVHGTRAVAIDRAGHAVETANGARFPYDRLLLATGSKARRLQIAGASPADLLYLRTFGEALDLRSRLAPGRRLALIGGGFIGLELAAAARQRGCEVTVIEMAPRLLARAVPADLAAMIAARHEAAGVRLLLGAGIERIEKTAGGQAIVLAGGERLECDGILAGIGALPETELAEAAGLAIENGIRTDERLQTSDADIYAAGDCCSFPLALYGGRRIRLEAWRNAQDQGSHVARAMLGSEDPYEAVPWFWSDQYDLTLQIAGLPDEGSETVIRDLGEGSEIRFHLAADGLLVAASAIGPNGRIAREVRLAEMLIARRARPDRAALADAGVKLKGLLTG